MANWLTVVAKYSDASATFNIASNYVFTELHQYVY